MPYNQDIIINTVVVVKTKPLWKQMHINADISRLPTSSQTVWLSATQSTVTVWCAFGWTEPNAGYTVNMPTTSRVWPGPAVCSSLHTSHTLHSHTDDTVHNERVIKLINYHATNAEYNWVTSVDHTWVSVESYQRLTCSVDQRYSIHYCNTAAYKLSTRLSDVSCPICNIRNTRPSSCCFPCSTIHLPIFEDSKLLVSTCVTLMIHFVSCWDSVPFTVILYCAPSKHGRQAQLISRFFPCFSDFFSLLHFLFSFVY